MAVKNPGEDKHDFSTLPDIIVRNIISWLSYDEISTLRLVNRRLDDIGQKLLNKGFNIVEKFHGEIHKEVKSKLPRRESERRNHSLARHVDILAAVETRLSLLTMTFSKYIDMDLCCFIPGKVLDEILHVLRLVKSDPNPPRAHELLQELRDISSMAMEHFDEKIVPVLKKKMPPVPLPFSPNYSAKSSLVFHPLTLRPSQCSSSPTTPPAPTVTTSPAQQVMNLCTSMRTQHTTLTIVKKEVADLKVKLAEVQRQNTEQENKLVAQNQMIEQQNERIAQQDKQIADVNRKMLEYDQKFVDLMAEVARVTSANRPDNSNFLPPVSDSNGNPLDCVTAETCSATLETKDNANANSRNKSTEISMNTSRPVTRKRKASLETTNISSVPNTRSAKNKKTKEDLMRRSSLYLVY